MQNGPRDSNCWLICGALITRIAVWSVEDYTVTYPSSRYGLFVDTSPGRSIFRFNPSMPFPRPVVKAGENICRNLSDNIVASLLIGNYDIYVTWSCFGALISHSSDTLDYGSHQVKERTDTPSYNDIKTRAGHKIIKLLTRKFKLLINFIMISSVHIISLVKASNEVYPFYLYYLFIFWVI